ncbi:FadR/GntR family transcriptional regulator [Paraburkholderia caballeronis]|uniref:Transcriptional regulator, GntR family n=1 Tax=Paraburkholderia caballeronis TaxID=416943 RepID=A0A1H7G4S4_9BURK|nr:FadR/GntR family transcriptional regulator [Paraburkholderia caballeronis]PXW24735.1 GntR family transcriptional regulator [Paraburkholderia caballeronis]PXX00465.1 GntR family transcriptional regulator [Paraburkholderia caballeronis]RAJ98528.1 GntR family transcriptional regulator [Paraburkholderia caballeronis]SEE66107.1 transcriptional regulator, GntR family [Paraburkholderia caballeronis]SEK32477.1 transcriptional regulator, GntR family [Paraburkholderia caballeronis]
MDSGSNTRSVLTRTLRQLEEGILRGEWTVDTRLPAERALATTLAVSRSTVREAIQRLVSKGLLETRPGSGVYVARRRPTGIAAPWLQLISESPPLRDETLEFRMVFECAAARFAAHRATHDEHRALERILCRMRDAVSDADVDAEARADAEFHATLTAASHNQMLDQFYGSVIAVLRDHIARNTYDATLNNANAPAQSLSRLRQHESIYDAIRDGNADAAQQAMLAHIEYVGRQFH